MSSKNHPLVKKIKQLGYTLKELADESKVPYTYLIRHVNGFGSMSDERFKRITELLVKWEFAPKVLPLRFTDPAAHRLKKKQERDKKVKFYKKKWDEEHGKQEKNPA